jgi:cytochrome P450
MKCKNGIKSGTAQPCFCIDIAAAQGAEGFRDDQAAYISGTLLEAGSDTTSSILYGFVRAMVLFPEVQKKAQERLDCVIGKDRLEDMDSFQYIRGCMKESLRFMPTTLTGVVPHAVTKGDEYMGYLIPKGARFLNNVYAIHHDPKRFRTQDALTQIAIRTIASHCTKPQATPMHPNGTHLLLVQVE